MGRPIDFALRGFAAADSSRLTAALAAETEFINRTLRWQLRILRARARQAAQNKPYARRFANMVVANVCGPVPFRLQSKAKFANGRLDAGLNRRHEAAWAAWGEVGACEFTGRWSRAQLVRLIVRTLAVDGEAILRLRRGVGPHGLMIELIDTDRLDDQRNESFAGGGAIAMGVEMDADARPLAYHLLKRRPAQWQADSPRESIRIPAEEIIHLFIPDQAEQVRGVPWMYAALLNLVHLGAFEEAAVIAAQVGAAQMGFLQSPDGEPPSFGSGADSAGNPIIDAEPGSFPVLPPGYQMAGWNPRYPDAAVEPFLRSCLRGVAAGLDVAYHNLTGDMTAVNYSSARIAELDERDMWQTLQGFVVDHLMRRLHREWIDSARLSGVVPDDPVRAARLSEVYFQGRRWAWVDPAKEIAAAREAVALRVKSRTRIAAEQGDDLEDILDEIAQEQQLAADRGIALETAPQTEAPEQPDAEDEAEDDTEEDEPQ